MDSEVISSLRWCTTQEQDFTYRVLDYPEDNLSLLDKVVWRGEEWLRDYDSYPDGGETVPAEYEHLIFILNKYNLPPDILPLDSVRYMAPEKLQSLQEQISSLGGPSRLRSMITLIAERGFSLEEYLGAGSWGIVFRTIRVNDGAEIALKILKPPYSKEWEKRFLREVKILKLITDANGLGGLCGNPFDIDGLMCLPMRYIKGRALSDLILPLEAYDALAITYEILSNLQLVHEKSIIHRDLHLGNIILELGERLVVVDFGVAREESITEYTNTFKPVGAMSHCAPEKWADPSHVSAASDVFSVGVILYKLLTGSFPFWADTYIKLYEQIRNGKFTNVDAANPRVPSFINIVLNSLLSPDLRYRPATANEALNVVGHAMFLLELDKKQKSVRNIT